MLSRAQGMVAAAATAAVLIVVLWQQPTKAWHLSSVEPLAKERPNATPEKKAAAATMTLVLPTETDGSDDAGSASDDTVWSTAAPRDILILMSDNRSPEDNEMVRNVALLNMLYARRHGYQFQLGTPPTCMHEHHGARAPQWCKLLVLYEVLLHGAAQLVVYMDTDAMFVRHDMSLAEYLSSSRGAARDDPFFRDVVMAPSADKALLVLSNNALNEWNTKFQHEHKFYTNSGVMFLRNSTRTLQALAEWWNTDAFRKYHFEPVYEQQALNQGLLVWRRHEFAAETFIINDTHFEPEADSFILHMTSKVRKLEARNIAERHLRLWQPPDVSHESLAHTLRVCCTSGPADIDLGALERQMTTKTKKH